MLMDSERESEREGRERRGEREGERGREMEQRESDPYTTGCHRSPTL